MTQNNQLKHIANGMGLNPSMLNETDSAEFYLPQWLPKNRTTLFTCARHALYHGWQSLNLPKDSLILVPAFVCNTVTDPLLLAGAKPIFYRVKENLTPDLNHAEDQIKTYDKGKVKAMLWYHYLGFSYGMKEARQFCKQHNIYFIEDGAHAIPGGTQLNTRDCPGSWGDITVFSIRKILPVLNAGALVINNRNLISKPNISWQEPRNSYLEILQSKEKLLCSLSVMSKNKIKASFFIKNHVSYVEKLNSEKKNIRESMRKTLKITDKPLKNMAHPLPPDPTSLQIIQNTKITNITQKRRDNFNTYLAQLTELSLFKNLPNNAVPLGFSILVPDRNEFRLRLAKKGVESTTHWPAWLLPKGAKRGFSKEKYLADHLLTLPCHQDLNQEDILYVCQQTKKVWKNNIT